MKITSIAMQEYRWPRTKPITNGLILEFYRDTVDPMWGRKLNEDGTVSAPGIGIDPDEAVLAPYCIA